VPPQEVERPVGREDGLLSETRRDVFAVDCSVSDINRVPKRLHYLGWYGLCSFNGAKQLASPGASGHLESSPLCDRTKLNFDRPTQFRKRTPGAHTSASRCRSWAPV
jgi:hypothetical protein